MMADLDDTFTPAQAWQDLVEMSDRTSPAEYPDMALITADELARYMMAVPRPMDTAPIDGTMVRVLVDYSDGGGPLDDAVQAWTIGFNNDGNVGAGEGNGWQFAGWCWSHDHFTEGKGEPIAWLPWVNPEAANG